MTTFSILGPLEVRVDAYPVSVPRPRRRAVLAYLLLHANDRVETEQLIDALWDAEPPRTARAQVHSAVSALRTGLPGTLGEGLVSEASGYRLTVAADQLDLTLFRRLTSAARAQMASRQFDTAVGSLRSALALWRGVALAGVEAPFVEPVRTRLEEERFSAYEALADLEMTAGRHVDLVPLLTGLLNEYPTRESLVERLALALYRGGRKTDALALVRKLRTLLAEEYGLDPERSIVELENSMLRGDPALEHQSPAMSAQPLSRSEAGAETGAAAGAGPGASTTGAAPAPPALTAPTPVPVPVPAARTLPRPAQLPRASAGFVGRAAELSRLTRLLSSDNDSPYIAVVTGPAGVGKTALALLWAHRQADAFPDGQLFVDLHGYDRIEAENADSVLERFLLALGIPGHDIPQGLPKREDLFRSAVAKRRMLLVLDNARDYQQISPLLPGSALSRTIITSRVRMGSLVADTGALTVRLGVLPLEESVEVLARIVGPDAVAGAPDASRELARLCAGLPLALRISAVRLLEESTAGIAGLAAELLSEEHRLSALDLLDDGRTVSQALEHSYRGLSAEQGRLFRLLSRHPVGTVSAAAAHALADHGELRFAATHATQRLLRALEAVHLLDQSTDGYQMHDLVRLYGRSRREPDDDAAFGRVIDWYISVAAAGFAVLAPAQPRLPADVTHRLTTSDAEPFDDEAAALAWFDQEIDNLVAVLRHAAEGEEHRVVWQIAVGVSPYLLRRHRLDALVETQRLGERAALGADNPPAAAMLANNLGIAYAMRQDPQAQEPFERAAAIHRALGDRRRAAGVTANLGSLRYDLGLLAEAAETQQRSLVELREFGHGQALSAALANLGLTLSDLGRYDEARKLYAEAIDVAEECGAAQRAGYARSQLAWVLLRVGEVEEGLAMSRAALRHAQDHEDVLLLGRMQDQVGIGLAMLGAWPEAHAAWQQAVETLGGIGSPEAEAVRARLRAEPEALPVVGPDGGLITPIRNR
jgi:DNA-binding SARP family transcriptional activator